MEKPILIIGFNPIGKAALEIFRSHNLVVYGFLDDNEKFHGESYDEIPILGSWGNEEFLQLIGKKAAAFVASDESKVRKSMIKTLLEDRKEMPVNAIHKNAYLPDSAHIGHGNFIDSGTVIGSNCKITNHCLIQSNATLEVEVEIGEMSHIGAGSILNSGVKVGTNVFIGSGSIIVSGLKIGDNSNIGAGSVVVKDVPKGKTVFGNPAKEIDI